ncbi:MAG: hypothetical protein ABIN01_08155 [Ferruginibacter sp.]
MKYPFFRILSYTVILVFFLYWTSIFILSLPSINAKTTITRHFPRFRVLFQNSWKLFTPPFTFNDRLYFIVRDQHNPNRADTLEVLEDIALQKQRKAPFNQRENIIDHSVNNTVTKLTGIIWLHKKMPSGDIAGSSDTAYISRAIAEASGDKNYQIYLGTLNNYCKKVLKEKNMDTGREVKMIITQKTIRPFNEMSNNAFLQKETVVFETPYNLLR